MYCQIALLSPPYSTLTYTTPAHLPENIWEIGMRVAVPLGKGAFRVGVILRIDTEIPDYLLTPRPSAKSKESLPESLPRLDSKISVKPQIIPVTTSISLFAHSSNTAVTGATVTTEPIKADTNTKPSTPTKEISIRPFIWSMERKSLLGQEYMDMVKQLALRQLQTEGRILGNVLPAGMRTTKNIRLRQFKENGKPRLYKLRDLGTLSQEELVLLGQDYMNETADILALAEDAALSERIILATDPPWSVRANAHKQREILDFLMDNGSISRRQFMQKMPDHGPALNTLIQNSLVKIDAFEQEARDEESGAEDFLPPPMPLFSLNETQQSIFDTLYPHLTCKQNTENNSDSNTAPKEKTAYTSLLYGVTGSGKTAIYLELAQYCMEQGRSVLLLAPEVAIALKLRQDAEARNMPVTLYHGYQSPKRREKIFRQSAENKEARLIVGTRSALFLPIVNVGLIILDEEHDDSFKQDEGLPYHAKDIAWYRMQKNKGLFLMGSATPDIKSFYATDENSGQKIYPRMEMKSRIGNALLPEIELVDIKDCKTSLAPESVIALKECINRGDQAIIMLNRRGYAPLLYCLDCATVARCPHCDIALAYHKKREQMTCHYCGYHRPFPSPCTECKSLNFLPMGEGTERLEEDIHNLLTLDEKLSTNILRLDRDSTRREGRMEEILNAFAKQEAQILVGTQMLSKGHHFPNVTLALIADADLGLNFPDYRAAERTFQLLTQASGRAGRGEKKGKVLIQTRDTKHYCWDFIKQGNYDAFYAHELALREKFSYPPFVRLALIRASWDKDQNDAKNLWLDFVKNIKALGQEHAIKIMGPSPAPISFLQGRFRFQCLMKGQNWNQIRQIFTQSLPQSKKLKQTDLRITLDIDPVNML